MKPDGPSALAAPREPLVILGPLPVYAAKPYAHLPVSAGVVEYVPHGSPLRWLWARPEPLPDAWGVRRASFPIPRGLRRLSWALVPLARAVMPPELQRARAVVLTSPFQSSLCGVFAGKPLIYHAFDEYESYGWTDDIIREREVKILRHCRHILVVSDALARVYRDKYQIPMTRITVLPNGYEPAPPRPIPADLAVMPSPRVGTLGNVNVRLRLDWVLEILEALPWASWTFVGNVSDGGPAQYRDALSSLRQHPRCAFVGAKAYDDLPAYAAGFDAAVFPLSDHMLNRASSPTRFFTQLPFGQPVLVSTACEQLVALQPMTRVCSSAAAFVQGLNELKGLDFQDGHTAARVAYAKQCTWSARARKLEATFDSVAPHHGDGDRDES